MRTLSAARKKSARRPGVEAMERRALMATSPLDPTFGTGGTASIPVLAAVQEATTLVQPDGKIVVVGGFNDIDIGEVLTINRYDVDGTPDPTFAKGGYSPGQAAVSPPAGFFGVEYGGSVAPGNAILQPDGKIVVAALLTRNGPPPDNLPETGPAQATEVVRLNADGTPDTTFGTNRVALIGTGAADLTSLAYQDGKIVLAGSITPAGATAAREAVARLDANGTLDTTFGTGGIATLAPSPYNVPPSVAGVAIDPSSGKIVLADTGDSLQLIPGEVAEAIRLDDDGSLDATFGAGGRALTSSIQTAAALAVQPDGKILIAGNGSPTLTSSEPALVRIDADGSTDATFRPAFAIPTGPSSYEDALVVTSLALQADGKVVVAGTLPAGPSSSFALDRFNTDGSKDATFGVGGQETFRLPSQSTFPDYDFPLKVASVTSVDPQIAIGPDGKIALAGDSVTSAPFQPEPAPSGGFTPQMDQLFVARLLAIPLAKPTPGDYTGDGVADPAVYLPGPDLYAVRPTGGPADVVQEFGVGGAGNSIPVPGDYDGDGKTDVAVYIPATATWAIRPSSGGPDEIVAFGVAGAGNSIPAPGDYDGSGRSELAVYIPSLAEFIYRPAAGGADVVVPFGAAGPGATIPAPGDYDGDGITDIAAYLPAYGAFAIRPSGGGADEIVPFGLPGAGNTIPAPGDYTGSGYTEIAAYLPKLGVFAFRPADVYNTPDVIAPFGFAGAGQTIPAPGDYTGDGKTDLAAYLPSLGVFAYRSSGGGPDVLEQFGIAGTGQTIPAAAIPYAYQGTAPAAPAGGGSTKAEVLVPLTDDLMTSPGTAKKKGAAG